MKDLIEQLKSNDKPFGLMSEEMQAKAKEIGKGGYFEFYNESGNSGVWTPNNRDSINEFACDMTYRLRADYTEPAEDEYESCEISVDPETGKLCYRRHAHVEEFIYTASSLPNFAGYRYEDGKICDTDLRFLDKAGSDLWGVTLEQIKSGEAIPFRPTHVVFKK